jgi:hypothetical protein
MADHNCSHPTCYETEDTTTIYVEQAHFDEDVEISVCGKHADFDKVHRTIVNDAASAVSNEILKALTE